MDDPSEADEKHENLIIEDQPANKDEPCDGMNDDQIQPSNPSNIPFKMLFKSRSWFPSVNCRSSHQKALITLTRSLQSPTPR